MKRKHLTDEQLQLLNSYLWLERDNPKALMIDILLRTGMRSDELVTLECHHLIKEDDRLAIKGAKNSEPRYCPIPKYLMERLARALARSNLSNADLVTDLVAKGNTQESRKRVLRRYFAQITMKIFGIGHGVHGLHCLRHTGAVLIFKKTKNNLMAAKLYLGHKSIQSTAQYLTHIQYDDMAELFRDATHTPLPPIPKEKGETNEKQ